MGLGLLSVLFVQYINAMILLPPLRNILLLSSFFGWRSGGSVIAENHSVKKSTFKPRFIWFQSKGVPHFVIGKFFIVIQKQDSELNINGKAFIEDCRFSIEIISEKINSKACFITNQQVHIICQIKTRWSNYFSFKVLSCYRFKIVFDALYWKGAFFSPKNNN